MGKRNQTKKCNQLFVWIKVTAGLIFVILLLIHLYLVLFGRSRLRANEAATIGSLKTLAAAQTDYNNNTYPHTYTGDLNCLGGGGWEAGFLDPALISGIKSGYKIEMGVSEPVNGSSWSWSATAWPIVYGETGVRTFYVDETGVVRGSNMNGLPGTLILPCIDDLARIPTNIPIETALKPIDVKKAIRSTPIPYHERYPLHQAVCDRNIRAIDELLNDGCDINSKDRHGYTPLHYAIVSIDLVIFLASRGADVNAGDHAGRAPLYWAVCGDSKLGIEARITRIRRPEGNTSGKRENTIQISNTDWDRIITALLDCGADINIRDITGRTPLHFAYICQHDSIGELLIKNGADPGILDNKGQTAADLKDRMEEWTEIQQFHANESTHGAVGSLKTLPREQAR